MGRHVLALLIAVVPCATSLLVASKFAAWPKLRAAVTSSDSGGELEVQQRQAIAILLRRLGVEATGDEQATLSAILAADDTSISLALRKESLAKEEEQREWKLKLEQASEWTKRRDGLTAYIASAKVQVAEAEWVLCDSIPAPVTCVLPASLLPAPQVL